MPLIGRPGPKWKLSRRSPEGCTGWVATCIVSVLLFALNVAICQDIYDTLQTRWWPSAGPQVKQAVLLILPAALLFVEWWIWEVIGGWWTARKSGL